MKFNHPSAPAMALSLALSGCGALAQARPVSGLYQIVSGSYRECCGFAGNEFEYALPDDSQSFVRLAVDPSMTVATLAFLGADVRTVFRTIPCPVPGPIEFSFSGGQVSPDRIVFRSGPGGPSPGASWDYAVIYSPGSLQIDGALGLIRALCADVPTRFSHSNLVATLVPGPRLTFVGQTKDRLARIMVQGQAGWSDVIEASSDLKSWTPVSTNFMDYTLCPICPYAIFEDPASTNRASRFYRAFEFK